ncbi:hypothetical protein KUTeg_012919 [Tegillarca granosa]|uniref:C2H2-type domain-containing protein n=1 Tax=Tegillarca granosa TaxID=220873 RepID=A0ABQ9ES94_TEGGR|nr:hypothetical protein KUTeg_012919 [Tegillarca granosa]
MVLHTNDSEIRCFTGGNACMTSRLEVRRSVAIPPNSGSWITVAIPLSNHLTESVYVEQIKSSKDIYLVPGIIDSKSENLLVNVLNCSDNAVTLQANSVIGRCEPYQDKESVSGGRIATTTSLNISQVPRMYQCWLCPSNFRTRRDLKNHVVPKPHAALSVVCPWCYEEEKSFNRTLDLKAHVEKKHKTTYQSLPVDLLTENNCFWLALKPSDYGRVVTPTDSHSSSAIQARSIILEWIKKGSKQTRSKDDWLNGWWKREVIKSPTPESEFIPVYEGDVEYDPIFPELNNTWDIQTINIRPGETDAILTNNNTYLHVELSDNIFKDERSVTALTRRITCCSNTSIPKKTDFNLLDNHNKEKYIKEIATTLGIQKKFIKTISRKTIFKEPPTKKPRISSPSKESKTPSATSGKPTISSTALPLSLSSSDSAIPSSYLSSSYYLSMPVLPATSVSSTTPLFNTTITKKPSSPKKVQKLQPSKHSSIGIKPKLPTSKSAIVKPTEKPIMQPIQ